MSLIHCDFYSNVLHLCMSMDVILPQPLADEKTGLPLAGKESFKTLWLLHGLSDDHTIWQRRTSIERYVEPLRIAVVMPSVHRSFYSDMVAGGKYWTYVSEEVPAIARALFPLSDRREDNFVAGLSMGGYGAFKLGLRHPERYAAAASLSGAVDIRDVIGGGERAWVEETYWMLGDPREVPGSENDLFALASKVSTETVRPRMYAWCGTEDFLYQANLRFTAHVKPLNLDYTFEESAGTHEWGAWDRQIQRVLEWMEVKA